MTHAVKGRVMKQIKAGLIGFGTIGAGVVKVFQHNGPVIADRLGAQLELVKIADLDITTERGVSVSPGQLTTDVEEILANPEIDIVIELIGGYEPARTFVLKAIANGKHVVTANKALLAVHGEEIFAAASKQGVDVYFEAAVAGGIPIISSIKENLCANQFSSVLGILNGTCNYILTRMTQAGDDFADVLKAAQDLGYAEADPTFDVEGIDAAHKLAILLSLCFGTRVNFADISTEGIGNISSLDIQFAEQFGYKIKLLAIGKRDGDSIEARVHPTMIPLYHPLADVEGVFNAVRLVGDFVGPSMQIGYGAGMEATASAVMGDVMAIARNMQLGGRGVRTPAMAYCADRISQLVIKPMAEIVTQYYLRFAANDQPGVLAQISTILGNYQISIASMIQPERQVGGAVPIVIMTHEAMEDHIVKALAEIDKLAVIKEQSRFIRIESELE